MNLSDKYRPRHFAAVAGQERAIAQIQAVLSRGWGGRAWWLAGISGTGKSTLARIIAELGADPFYIDELDAQTLTPARLADVEQEMRYSALGNLRGKCYIVNEAHGLRTDTIRLLLVVLERLPAHVSMIFTTTKAGERSLFDDDQDAGPLVSRCTQIDLDAGPEAARAMAARAKKIAQAEGIDGLPDDVYLDALAACRGNLRMLLQRIESGRFASDAQTRRDAQAELVALGNPAPRTRAAKRRAELEAIIGDGA